MTGRNFQSRNEVLKNSNFYKTAKLCMQIKNENKDYRRSISTVYSGLRICGKIMQSKFSTPDRIIVMDF